MKKYAVLMVFMCLSLPCWAGDGKVITHNVPHIPNLYLAGFSDPNTASVAASANDAVTKAGAAIDRTYPMLNSFSFYGNATAAAAISRDPRISFVEEAGYSQITSSGTQLNPPGWGLDRMNQKFLPLDNNYSWAASGITTTTPPASVVIYVIDTGVNAVSDLGARLTTRESFVSLDSSVDDCGVDSGVPLGHGTSVAVIAAGTTYGVAKDAQIVSLRAFNCSTGTATDTDLLGAINRMITLHNQHPGEFAVANWSWINSTVQQSFETATVSAIDAGILVVTAAGDANVDACTRSPANMGSASSFPSGNPHGYTTLTVASSQVSPTPYDTNGVDVITPGTNTGPCVSIFAPNGVATLDSRGGLRPSFTGTSAAVPHVAGQAAVQLSYSQLANQPMAFVSLMKSYGWANVISNVPTNTPNLLLSSTVYLRRR